MSTNPTPTVSQPLNVIEENVLAVVVAAGGLAVGLGAFGSSTDQILISTAGIIGAAIVKIANQLHRSSLAKAGLLRR